MKLLLLYLRDSNKKQVSSGLDEYEPHYDVDRRKQAVGLFPEISQASAEQTKPNLIAIGRPVSLPEINTRKTVLAKLQRQSLQSICSTKREDEINESILGASKKTICNCTQHEFIQSCFPNLTHDQNSLKHL